jgi:hypothetical protein
MRDRQQQDSAARILRVAGKAISSHQNLLSLLALLALLALADGCAEASALSAASTLGGALTPSTLEIHNNTEVRLQEKNFIVIKTNVIGQSKGFSLLGILTVDPAKFTTAMGRLYDQAQMQPRRPQTLVNLIMEKDSSYFLLFSILRTSIRADVIEFTPGAVTNTEPRPPPEESKPKTE